MTIDTVHIQSKNARSLSFLRSGSFVSFTVRERKGKGVFLVLLNGKMLQVHSKDPLVSGRQYRAEIFKRAGIIELHVQKQQPLVDKVLESLSLPQTTEMELAVTALMKTGLSVNTSMIHLLRRGADHVKKKDASLFRLLAVMMDKNIPLTKDAVLSLYGFTGNNGDHQGRQYRRKKKDPPKSEVSMAKDVSSSTLKKYIMRDDREDTLLKYFNHRKGRNGNWFIIPITYRTDTEHAGVLKVHIDSSNTVQGFNLMLRDSHLWEFVFQKEGEGYRLHTFSPVDTGKREMMALFSDLREKLHKKGIKTDDISSSSGFSDGFLDTENATVRGVNHIV